MGTNFESLPSLLCELTLTAIAHVALSCDRKYVKEQSIFADGFHGGRQGRWGSGT